MKLCVFSDIHGNLAALEAALPLMLNEAADLNLFLGDLCGYYFEAVRCRDLLELLPRTITILGNHDVFFIDSMAKNKVKREYTRRYGPSLQLMLQQPEGRELARWLKLQPDFWQEPDLGCAAWHSPPGLDYLYPDTPLPDDGSYPPFVFSGHTHYPMAREKNGVLFFNPGSIGQPRHGGSPTYGTVDLKKRTWEIHEFDFDVKGFTDRLCGSGQADHPSYLIDVFRRKK
jgi:predicted phosphodiesterase